MPSTTAPPSVTPWYNKRKYRRCQDGSDHEGRLELVTWSTPAEGLGFAACDESESEELKQKFEVWLVEWLHVENVECSDACG